MDRATSSPLARLTRFIAGAVFAIVTAATPLSAQDVNPPTANVSPTSVTSSPATITIDWCDDNALNPNGYSITLNGADVTWLFSYNGGFDPNCASAAQSVGTVTLQPGSNNLRLQHRDGSFNWMDATYTIRYDLPPVVVPYRLSDGASVGANANGSNTQLFLVKNPNSGAGSYSLSSVCSGSVTCGSVTPSFLLLAAGDSAWVSMPYTSGAVTTTGVVKLHAATGSASDDGWVNVTNQYLAVNADITTSEVQSLGLCEVSCFTATQALSTVPYVSLDQPRSVTLLYNGDRLAVRPFVHADVVLAAGASTPTEYWLEVKDSTGASITFLNGDTKLRFSPPGSPTATTVRLSGQIDASAYTTGLYPIRLVVTWANGSPASAVESRTILTNLLVVNDRKSSIAKGWGVAGLQRLYQTQGGVLITDGAGSASFFRGCGAGCYLRPQGEFSTVTSTGSGGSLTFRRAYPDSTVAVFNNVGLLQRIVGRLQDTVSFTYDGSNRLTQITDPFRTNGSSTHLYTQISYGTYGLSSIQEPGLFTNQSGGRTTSVSVASDSTLSTWTDPDGVPTRLIYDGSKRLTGIANRRGDTTSFNYREDASWKLDTIQSPRFTKDDGSSARITTRLVAWQVASVPYATTASTMFTPVARDSVFGKVIDQGGHVSQFTVNAFGQAVKSIAAAGTNRAMVTISYMNAAHGILPDSIRSHTGGVDRFTYDADGRLLTKKPAGERTVVYHYGAFGQVDSIGGTDIPAQRVYLGARGRIDSVKVAGSHVTKYTYDSRQRVLTVADPEGHTSHMRYEATFGNQDSTAGPGGQTTLRRFDGMGRDTASRGNDMPWLRTLLDNMNRVVKTVHDTGTSHIALPDSVRYVYDSLYLRQVKDGLGQTYAFQYNGLGAVTQRTDPASNSDRYFFDAEGRQTRWINRRGDTVFTSYDVLHRLAAKTGTKVVADSFAVDSAGRKAARWNAVARDSIFTDANGWTDSIVRRFATDSTKRFMTTYTPDSLHRLVTMVPSGPNITFATRTYSWSSTTGTLDNVALNAAAVGMNYDQDFNRSSAVLPGSVTRTEAHTTMHALFSLSFNASGVDQYLWRRVTTDGFRITDAYGPAPTNIWKTSFKYDVLRRLVQAADSGLVYQNQCDFPVDPDTGSQLCDGYVATATRNDTWSYDAVGNVASVGGTTSGTPTYTTGNRIASWPGYTFSHDADGNVTGRDTTGSTSDVSYEWSADGLLTRVIKGSDTTFYDYDAGGVLARRRKKNNVDRHFWWDSGHLLAELDASLGKRVGEYAYYPGTDKPMALLTGDTAITNKYFFQQDALGNVYGLTDESGNVIRYAGSHIPWGDRSEWSSFGATSADSNRLGWKALLQEKGITNLYYVRARWYDPVSHRFLSEDPLGTRGGINPYAFADNDPVNSEDPTGLMTKDRGACSILATSCGKDFYQWLAEDVYDSDFFTCHPEFDPGCRLKRPWDKEIAAIRDNLKRVRALGGHCVDLANRGEKAIRSGSLFFFDGPRPNEDGDLSLGDNHDGQVHVSRLGADGSINSLNDKARIFRHEVKHLLKWTHEMMQQPEYRCDG